MSIGSSIFARPFLPLVDTSRHYSLSKLRRDLLAGLTVSVVEVPQAMAYALIAGVPPQYGLYTSIIQGIIGALLSSCEHLTTGPTNTQSLLIASTVVRLSGSDPQRYLQLVFALTLLKGLIQLGFAAANLGNMVRYVSRSVIVGVSAGAGVLIMVGQVPNFIGIASDSTRHLPGVLGQIERMLPHLGDANWRCAALGAGCLAVVLAVRSISKLLPSALLAVVLAAGVVAALGWDLSLPVVGHLPKALPTFGLPAFTWTDAEALMGGALALALLGMLESVAIAKTIAGRMGERINPNQEFLAQGVANALSSFFHCIPGSGSFTRSALDYAAGAQTRFAAVFNALFVGAIFWLLAAQARYIPLTSLAAILMVIAVGLIEWTYLVRVLRSNRADAGVCIITFCATLLAPLEFAIFIGIFLNIGLYLRQASRLHVAEMVQTPGGRFLETPLADRCGNRKVILLQVEGDLFFGVADELQDRLRALPQGELKVVIFRLRRTHSIDSTVLNVLEQFVRQMQSCGRHVIFCGVRDELMGVLKRYGLVETIGKDNVFRTGSGVFASVKQAIERARQLVGSSIDADAIEIEDDGDELSYEI